MFDPGAMGTLVLGLDNVRRGTGAEAGYPIDEPLFGAAPRRSGVRARIADGLRAAADRLQPPAEVSAALGWTQQVADDAGV
jgi:hypothetical protein